MTQTELGDRVGIYYQNIARYERGASEPTWAMVIAIAAAMGATPDAFLEGEAAEQADPPAPPPPTSRPMGKRK